MSCACAFILGCSCPIQSNSNHVIEPKNQKPNKIEKPKKNTVILNGLDWFTVPIV